MSRLKMTVKNIFYGYLSSFILLIMNFISRTIFIQTLGTTYLGINGLFVNVLGVLSFAELGVGSALNYCLYKPVAEHNIDKLKTLMNLYKKAYRAIALVVAIIGIAIIPFLKYIVKDPVDVGNITIYYIIFLFNTVSSYFVSFKFSIINAEQKNYVFTNINTITTVITLILQIFALLLYKSFLVYLIVAAVIGLLQKIYINNYLNRRYPYLLEKNICKLEAGELKFIIKNIKGLVWHKVGEISVHQTDNIVISTCINITTVGLISNYNLFITFISNFLNQMFSSVVSSFGNMVATEDKNKQVQIFKVYNFVDFWFYGFASIALVSLLEPLITLWIGRENLVDQLSLILICLNLYFAGQRIAFLNFKTAFGIFYDDKYIVLQVAVINLIISILLANYIGLPGIYIGTLVSGLYQSIRRPIVAYKRMTGQSVSKYFYLLIKYFLIVLSVGIPIYVISHSYLQTVTIEKFICMAVVVVIIPNLYFFVLLRKTKEYEYCKNMVMSFGGKLNVRK